MAESTYNWYRTPLGFITICANDVGITLVTYGCKEIPGATRCATPLTTRCANQILSYLAGKSTQFEFPLALSGTEFQLQVWHALQEIPYGESMTASEMAAKLQIPGAQRSIGTAVRANPLAIIIPDHRIIAATGKAFGVGKDAERREWLRKFEEHHRGASEGQNS